MLSLVVVSFACWLVGAVADCRIDWSRPCPAGWDEQPGQAGQCAATASYGGPCATLQSAALSTAGKQRLAQQCGVGWPCIGGSDSCPEGVDFSGCPQGWKETSQGLCGAPPQYFGNCHRTLQFDGDDDDKEDVQLRCGVRWPCKSPCNEDFSAACPEGWRDLGEQQCLAPRDYHGSCLPMQNLAEFAEDQKRGFALACTARWPCQEVVSAGPRCEFTESICPEAWDTFGGGAFPTYCHSADYRGPCRSRISADRINQLGVETVMERCGVQWPCEKITAQTSQGSSVGPPRTEGNEGGPIMDNGSLSAETSRTPNAPPRAGALH